MTDAPDSEVVMQIWYQVVMQNNLMTEEQWNEVHEKFTDQQNRIPFQTILMTSGYVPPKKIPLMRVIVETRVWKNVLTVHNLISAEQWKACFSAFEKSGGRTPIRKILQRQRLLDDATIEKLHRRVKAMFGEKVGAPAPPSPPEEKKFTFEEGATPPTGAKSPPAARQPAAPPPPRESITVAQHGLISAAQFQPPAQPSNNGRVHDEAWRYLCMATQMGASDLHLTAGSRPFVRLHGELRFFDAAPITPDLGRDMVLSFLNDEQRETFLETQDLDLSWQSESVGRVRANALVQFRGPSIILRIIPAEVPTLEKLGLPNELAALTEWTQGLVLVTGPAGCGKSTTAAALINCVNEDRKDHIITVEDPIEYLHPSKQCNVTQRQVHPHTQSFSAALKAALREDPDVIMIGEMRDLETISLAMTAAETGHLVIGTLHTKSAARTIDRIVDVFPSDQQAQVRTMLAGSLRGIITQQLVRKADGSGRVAALETLYVNTAVANLIRDSKTFQLPSVMQTGRKHGQRLMDESLDELVKSGTINKEDAIKVAENPKRFQ